MHLHMYICIYYILHIYIHRECYTKANEMHICNFYSFNFDFSSILQTRLQIFFQITTYRTFED